MAGIASLAGLGYWLRRRKRVYGEHASEIVSQCTNVVYFRQADVESANQGTEVDTTTASGKFVFGIFAALAEFERELSWNESKRAWKRPAPAVGKAGGSFP